MSGRVEGGVIARRSDALHRVAEEKKREFYASQKGNLLRVLFEERAADGHFVGFSDNYVKVGVAIDADLSNRLGTVTVTSVVSPGEGDHARLLAVGELVEMETGAENSACGSTRLSRARYDTARARTGAEKRVETHFELLRDRTSR
jgi:hypothetical protein